MDRSKEMWERYRNEFSCIKLPANGKQCFTKGWTVACAERQDVGDYDPKANLGVAMGRASNLIVVDVDNPAIFKKWVKTTDWNVKESHVIKTASGKYHIYFRYSEHVAKFVKGKSFTKTMPDYGFELLVDKAFAVAPPSRIGDGRYRILYDNPIQDFLPQAVLKAMLACKPDPRPKPTGPVRIRTVEQVWRHTKAQEKIEAAAAEGTGMNNLVHWTACRMAESCPDRHDHLEEVIQWAKEASGLKENELRATILSAWGKPAEDSF